MDNEKKYNELVGKIKKAYLYAQTGSTKAVLEDILPELAESKDEKIRKAIYGWTQAVATFSLFARLSRIIKHYKA